VKGLVVLMEGTKFNHVPFFREPDLHVLSSLSLPLGLTAALISGGFTLPGGWGQALRILCTFWCLATGSHQEVGAE
jgi:hypothetical protein